MFFIVQKRDDGQCELKTLQFGLGQAFSIESPDYENRVLKRADIILAACMRWEKTYEGEKAASLSNAFSEIHFCFESEAELPYIACLLEYDSLRPQSERNERDRKVAGIFQNHLAALEDAEAYIQIAQRCCFILPDHLIGRDIGNAVTTIANKSQSELQKRREIYMSLFMDSTVENRNDWFIKFCALQRFYPADGLAAAAEAWVALAKQTKAGPEKINYLESLTRGQENNYEYQSVHASLALQAHRYSLERLKIIARRAYFQLRNRMRDRDALSLNIFLQALASDFDFGEQGRRNRQMIQALEQATEAGLETLRPKVKKQQKKTVIKTGGDDGTEEALWAWSLDKIVDYVGPVGRKGKGRKKKKKVSQTQPKVSPEITPEISIVIEEEISPVLSEEDAPLVDLGLRNSLALLIEESKNALQYAKGMNIDGETVEQLYKVHQRMLEFVDLETLPQSEVDDCLDASGTLLETLRREIEKVQEIDNLLVSFDDALAEACSQEALVYGKRYGGVIDYALTLKDWPLINDNYHNRLVTGCSWIRIGRKGRYLRKDEAIAFYVTFTSLSGSAFDISAHLWRRYEDADDAPPTLPSDGGLPLMDRENWYDTFIPCFVLHIPYKH